MKTKEEIVEKAISDFNRKHESDENWLKSRVAGAWNSGFKNGYDKCTEDTYRNIMLITPNEAQKQALEKSWNEGYSAGRDSYVKDWKKRAELTDELKREEYQRGYDAGFEEGKKEGYDSGSKKNLVETIFSLADEKKQAEYQRGLEDAWNAAKKIFLLEEDGGFPYDVLCTMFKGSGNPTYIFKNFSAEEVVKLIDLHKEN